MLDIKCFMFSFFLRLRFGFFTIRALFFWQKNFPVAANWLHQWGPPNNKLHTCALDTLSQKRLVTSHSNWKWVENPVSETKDTNFHEWKLAFVNLSADLCFDCFVGTNTEGGVHTWAPLVTVHDWWVKFHHFDIQPPPPHSKRKTEPIEIKYYPNGIVALQKET